MLVADMQANLRHSACPGTDRLHLLTVVLPTLARVQLQKGKYVRDHSRLEVQPTGRFFLNMMLGGCLSGRPASSSVSKDSFL